MYELRRNLDTYADGYDLSRDECMNCGGSGRCYPCGGKGTTGYQDEEVCQECAGTGVCIVCNGTGEEREPEPAPPHDMFDDPPETWDLPL